MKSKQKTEQITFKEDKSWMGEQKTLIYMILQKTIYELLGEVNVIDRNNIHIRNQDHSPLF